MVLETGGSTTVGTVHFERRDSSKGYFTGKHFWKHKGALWTPFFKDKFGKIGGRRRDRFRYARWLMCAKGDRLSPQPQLHPIFKGSRTDVVSATTSGFSCTTAEESSLLPDRTGSVAAEPDIESFETQEAGVGAIY